MPTGSKTEKVNNMARYLRPERFEEEPNTSASDLKWAHWRITFENFMAEEYAAGTTDSMKQTVSKSSISNNILLYTNKRNIRRCD